MPLSNCGFWSWVICFSILLTWCTWDLSQTQIYKLLFVTLFHLLNLLKLWIQKADLDLPPVYHKDNHAKISLQASTEVLHIWNNWSFWRVSFEHINLPSLQIPKFRFKSNICTACRLQKYLKHNRTIFISASWYFIKLTTSVVR